MITVDNFMSDSLILVFLDFCVLYVFWLVVYVAEFSNRVASYDDNLLGKDRKVIRTPRGFLMTVDKC